jgi:Bacterial membrane protein YfhO
VQRRATIGWLLLFLPVTALFYWKIVLTSQFSLLTDREAVNQGYAWMHFTITSIRHGSLPIWDPYTLSGRSFPGEMQTAAFYPIHLLLALIPFNHASVLSPVTYHVWFAATHVLAACFMFALIRELELSRFSAFIGGICFSLGGYVAYMAWPHLLESATWLPLVFLFLLRALRATTGRLATLNACIGGLMLGMSVLAGGLHVVLMELLVIVSAGIYYACSSGPESQSRPLGGLSAGLRAAIVISVLGGVGLAAGAVQLFPSVEYSGRALRFLGAKGALPANQPIPYADMDDEFLPQGIALFIAPFAFNGNATLGEATSPYIGVFPLLAAIIGIRRYWRNRWVRYLAGLAVAAFLFAIGNFSWLHGVLYATVPKLWSMREASRMVLVTDFALAILAAYGVEALIVRNSGQESTKAGWPGLNRTLLGIVIACGAALFVPAIFAKPDINPWNSLSILMIFAAYGLFRYLEHGNRGRGVQAIMIGLILFDLSSRDWTAVNRIELTKSRVDLLDQLMSARATAQFLKAQPGLFRVQLQTDPVLNIGDLFGVPMIQPAGGVTLPIDYARMLGFPDLLNVRYIITPAKEQKPGAVYHDNDWKVYENPSGYPRAWTVHETKVEPSAERAAELLGAPGFDAHRTALTEVPVALEPLAEGAREAVQASMITPTRMELEVDAQSRGLLVLSENYYPGWRATIEGQSAPIYRVDSGLRGVVVPRGHSRVVLSYAPASVYWGGLLTSVAFLGTLVVFWLRNRRAPAIR